MVYKEVLSVLGGFVWLVSLISRLLSLSELSTTLPTPLTRVNPITVSTEEHQEDRLESLGLQICCAANLIFSVWHLKELLAAFH